MKNLAQNEKIKEILRGYDVNDYRYSQIFKAIYQDPEIIKYSDIFTLPSELRGLLSAELGDEILTLKSLKLQKVGETEKVLFETLDGLKIETVKMHYEGGRNTFCVSTQCGCGLNCVFCATGKMGLKRNLTCDEIVDQVLYFRKNGYEVDNIVFMGMGEPLVNPETFKALDILTDQKMFGIGKRRVSVSTVGIVPGIEKMTKDYPQINLAFSLHTPFQKEREKIMPVSKIYPIKDVMDVLAKHIRVTNRKVFIAYILFGGLTDSEKHANGLVELLRSYKEELYLFHVNLINYHEISRDPEFKKTSRKQMERFQNILDKAGIRTTVRQDFGEGIDAACGQLSGGNH